MRPPFTGYRNRLPVVAESIRPTLSPTSRHVAGRGKTETQHRMNATATDNANAGQQADQNTEARTPGTPLTLDAARKALAAFLHLELVGLRAAADGAHAAGKGLKPEQIADWANALHNVFDLLREPEALPKWRNYAGNWFAAYDSKWGTTLEADFVETVETAMRPNQTTEARTPGTPLTSCKLSDLQEPRTLTEARERLTELESLFSDLLEIAIARGGAELAALIKATSKGATDANKLDALNAAADAGEKLIPRIEQLAARVRRYRGGHLLPAK